MGRYGVCLCKHTQAHFHAHSMHNRCPSAWDTELLSVHPGIARMVNKCVLKHTHTHTHTEASKCRPYWIQECIPAEHTHTPHTHVPLY